MGNRHGFVTRRFFCVVLSFAAACALYAAAGLAGRRASAQAPAAGHSNGLIAFVSNRDGIYGEIYAMNPDGGGRRNLTNSPASEVCPAFSPDGLRLAFVRDWNKLLVMNADGSGQPTVVANAGGELHSLMCADWSPDGTRLAFAGIRRDDLNNQDVYVVGADGTGLARLTTDPADDSAPRWSPDGSRIAFNSIRDRVPGEVNYEIYVMNADGSGQTRLTNNTKFDHSPAFSPDGSRIAFTSRRDDNFEIYVMNADGSGQARLTDNPEQDTDPEWSPDGTLIAFTSSRGGRFGEIYTMRPDGTALSNLTDDESFEMDPSWQRLAPASVIPPAATPTPGPASTPAPPASTAETFEPYVPSAGQTELNALVCGGRTFIKVKFTFNTSGYRVVEQGAVERSGGSFAADVKVERWTGGTLQVLTYAELVYDLGELAPGTYTFTLRSRGATVKSTQFTAGQGSSSPSDDPAVFVAQHYRDFLGREPDAEGFRFWTGNMTAPCGSDAACLERRRVDTSAAFFISIEFQRTGFFVHRLYRASYGRAPRREELLPDARRIARGVVVNAPGWEALLADNTRAFLDEWVARPEFDSAFGRLSDSQFVELLARNSGVVLDPKAGEALAAALSVGGMTRAQALRAVVEEAEFSRKEFGPAFVLMQYFGYLQRNPDEGPDSDTSGYDYWLSKLEQFGGDYRRAEMVKAFISSDEYRARFCTR